VSATVAEGSELRRAIVGLVLGAVLGLVVRALARPENGGRSS